MITGLVTIAGALAIGGLVAWLWARVSPKRARDIRIVDMRNRGMGAAEIAAALGVPEATVHRDLERLADGDHGP